METDYLLRSPENVERLKEAMARADAGEGQPLQPPGDEPAVSRGRRVRCARRHPGLLSAEKALKAFLVLPALAACGGDPSTTGDTPARTRDGAGYEVLAAEGEGPGEVGNVDGVFALSQDSILVANHWGPSGSEAGWFPGHMMRLDIETGTRDTVASYDLKPPIPPRGARLVDSRRVAARANRRKLMNHVSIIPAGTSPGAHPNPTRQVLRRLARLAATIVIVGLPGCGLFSAEHRVIGIIDFDDSAWPLPRIPETATAGVPLEMVIRTMETGCYRQGDTEVEVDGRSAVVTPYDFLDTGGDAVCPAYLGFFEHGATVVFEKPGTAEIVLVYSTGSSGTWDPASHKGDGRKVYTVEVVEAG